MVGCVEVGLGVFRSIQLSSGVFKYAWIHGVCLSTFRYRYVINALLGSADSPALTSLLSLSVWEQRTLY